MQRTLKTGRFTEGAMKLELQDMREEVACIGCIRRNVVLGAGIEIVFAPSNPRADALILLAKLPARGVVLVGRPAP